MRWKPLVALGTAQFLAVLDTSVMNVSISQLVADFHTTVTAIQAVITVYTLVMAAFMITGGKVGDRIGRRRAFAVGLVVYAVGSLLTSVAPTLPAPMMAILFTLSDIRFLVARVFNPCIPAGTG